MPVRPEHLARELEGRLRPVYLISGDETLLVQECADQVRAAARRGGCSERRVLDAGDRSFRWQDLLDDAGNLSLFAEQRLLELRIPSGKPGKDGSQALQAYLDSAAEGDVLLIVAGKIDKASTSSKWHKAIDAAGITVQVWPVAAHELPRWLEQRAKAQGLQIEREALGLLAERVEGNLLAAVQELEKLRLISDGERIGIDQVTSAVANSARFSLFGMIDIALAGRVEDALRMLHGLRAEGAQPAALVWGLSRELHLLRALINARDAGRSPVQAMTEARVWKSRQGAVGAALARHNQDSCASLLQITGKLDASTKGFGPGNPWEIMELLLIGVAREGSTPLPV